MREGEYKRLRRQIETEYQEKLKALDMVFRMSGGAAKNNGSGRKSKGVVSQAVQSALKKMSGEFTVQDIEKQIMADDPNAAIKRASISSTLKRLAEDKEITCTVKGKGKRASKYRA